MGFKEQSVDTKVGSIELSFCRELPGLEKSGMSLAGYAELTKDPHKNRQAILTIIKEYQNEFAFEDHIDEEWGGPAEDETDVESSQVAWTDRNNLEKFIKNARLLLKGELTPDTLHYSTALVASYYSFVSTNVDCHVKEIHDLKAKISHCHSENRRLEIETQEPETLEEISRNSHAITHYQNSMSVAQKNLTPWVGKLRLSLQASYFVTTQAVS